MNTLVLARLLAVSGLALAAPALLAQQTSPPPPVRVIARTMFGETALEIRARASGIVHVGVAADTSALSLDLVAGDVRRFAQAVSTRLTPRRGTKRAGWVERVEEPGVGAGAMSLSLVLAAKESTFTLFASDESLANLRQRLSRGEVRIFVRHLHTAAAVAAPRPAVRKRPVARKPNVAAKRP